MTLHDADDMPTVPAEGDVLTAERTFTVDDVREFGRMTGDQQSIHTETDEDGRLVVQGLLTASLMTSIGGDLEYMGRTMNFSFRKPVRTGETITCECTVVSRTERDERYLLEIDVEFSNDRGDIVLEAETTGLVRKPDAG